MAAQSLGGLNLRCASPLSCRLEQIPIRGDDFSWEYEGRGATDGKQVRNEVASARRGYVHVGAEGRR